MIKKLRKQLNRSKKTNDNLSSTTKDILSSTSSLIEKNRVVEVKRTWEVEE